MRTSVWPRALPTACARCVDWDYLFLGLGDMPYIRRETLATAESAHGRRARRPRACIVVPMFRGSAGHPVGFSREFFAELIALTGDRGARSVIDAHPDAVQRMRSMIRV